MCANRMASRFQAIVFTAVLTAAAIVCSIAHSTTDAKEPEAKQAAPNAAAAAPSASSAAKTEAAPDGAELFAREWLPNDSRAHGGDGLGPVFNDSSCIACHSQGGPGGAGPTSKNADIITAFVLPTNGTTVVAPETLPQGLFNLAFGGLAAAVPTPVVVAPVINAKPHKMTAKEKKFAKERELKQLIKIHPAFATSRSVVLHHFGTDPKYQEWRNRFVNGGFSNILSEDMADDAPQITTAAPNVQFATFQGVNGLSGATAEMLALQQEVQMKHPGVLNATTQIGNIQISHSQRNPIALFGIGQIDAIPEKAITDLAKLEQEKYPDAAGRPAKLRDGKIGRFGWKDQKPSLEDFALTACAIELGLNVPGHDQAGVPLNPKYKAPGLDMDKAECDALVSYLRNLPAPVERQPATAQEAAAVDAGHKLFASVGCAQCHVEKVGPTAGLYSDLLLHDMGTLLGDEGQYDLFTPDAPEEEQDEAVQPVAAVTVNSVNGPQQVAPKMSPEQKAKLIGALRQEWRTAPLWGVRDSGPYLHDGRADTLEQAVAFHGGQGAASAQKFFRLKPEERAKVITFLKSLTAPEPTPRTVKLAAR